MKNQFSVRKNKLSTLPVMLVFVILVQSTEVAKKQLQCEFGNHAELYNFLVYANNVFLPPRAYCDKFWLGDILEGKREYITLDKKVSNNLQHSDGFTVKDRIQMIVDAGKAAYLPTPKKKKTLVKLHRPWLVEVSARYFAREISSSP